MEAGNRGRGLSGVCVLGGLWSGGFLDAWECGRELQWTDAGKKTELAAEQVALCQVYGCVEQDS